jgi:hypothetical protein
MKGCTKIERRLERAQREMVYTITNIVLLTVDNRA